MFTGLIETTGVIKDLRRSRQSLILGITPRALDFNVSIGASVAVNGACLTLESVSGDMLMFTAVRETLSRTTLAKANRGDSVNLERALPASGRLDGHFVLGHVDGVGIIIADSRQENAVVRSIRAPAETQKYMAEKGSVAIDGISLTIARRRDGEIDISFIPYTLEHTTMALKRPGDEVNIECDVLARYCARLLENDNRSSGNDQGVARGNSILDVLERSGF
jgi:riboflavin synthase